MSKGVQLKSATLAETKSGILHYASSCISNNSNMLFSDVVYQVYNNGRPIIAGLHSVGIGHMVVVKGYVDDATNQYVYYLNPSNGATQLSLYSSLGSSWSATIYNIH